MPSADASHDKPRDLFVAVQARPELVRDPGRRDAFQVMIADPGVLRGRRLGNIVLLASDAPLPVEDLGERVASDPFSCEVTQGPDLADFQGDAEPVTDADMR